MPADLPAPLRRREILYNPETPPETLVECGQAYEDAGRIDDALQFFAQAKDLPGLKRMKAKAFELGDAFMLKRIAGAMPELVEEADWKELLARAESLGKDLYAEQARGALEGHLDAMEPEEKRGQGKA